MSDIAVDLVNVTKRFGREILAVDDMTLHIEQGEYISFIGPSGCGKTTTLRMVSGFEEPTTGQILVAGRDCTHLEPHERNTAMVFQHFALFPHPCRWRRTSSSACACVTCPRPSASGGPSKCSARWI